MIHAFDTDIAERHGVAAAIVHQEILRWCQFNERAENKQVFVDGHYWMYTSHSRIQKHISYFSERTIRRALETLVESGLMAKRNRAGENPNALIYRALVVVYEKLDTPMDKMAIPCGQNDHTPYGQNGHSEHRKEEHRKKKDPLTPKKANGDSSHGEAVKTNKPDPSNPRYAMHKKIALAAYEQMGKMVLPSNPIVSTLMGVIQDCTDCWSLDQQADLLPKIITQMVEHRTSLPADHPDKQKDPIYNLPAFLKYQGRGSAADHPYGSALSRERAEPEKEDFTPAPEMQEAINAILVGKEMPSPPNYKMLRDALPELGPYRRVKPVKRVRKKLTEEERRELLLKMDPPDTRIPEVVG